VAIEQAGLADVVAGPSPGLWRIRTGPKVGVVVGDTWELRVTPRLRVPRLMFLLGYARDQSGWKRLQAHFAPDEDLFSAIASGFSWHASWAIDRGLLRGYIGREERRHDLRGRVLFETQIARGALPVPAHVRFDDFTQDILENRMLRTVSQLLLRLPRVPDEARKRLLRVKSVLEGVSTLTDWRNVTAPPVTRLNERYTPALKLAELVLAGASLSANIGEIRSTTFVFDMNKVFEDFVTAAFREAMRQWGGVVRDQVTPYSLDEAHQLSLKPDLSWWNGAECLAVIDAKYKAIDEGLMRHPDAYQMLAYCIAYGLRQGYLVYAKDSGQEPRTHRIRHSGHEIVVATIDVEKEPDDVLADVVAVARDVALSAKPKALEAA
jgi:5-methylcytosine-specific restriction enzyme subunit McrC